MLTDCGKRDLTLYEPKISSHTETQFCSCRRIKEYSGVSLIHGLNHSETVLHSLSRDQVSRLLIYGVLSTSETTA